MENEKPDYVCDLCGMKYYSGEVNKWYATQTGWLCQCGADAESLMEPNDDEGDED